MRTVARAHSTSTSAPATGARRRRAGRERPGDRDAPGRPKGRRVDGASRPRRTARRAGRSAASRASARPGPRRCDRAVPVPPRRLEHRRPPPWCAFPTRPPRCRPSCRVGERPRRAVRRRGSGTGLAGGAMPLDGAVVIVDSEDERGCCRSTPLDRLAWVEPGRAEPRSVPAGRAPRPALRPRPEQPAELLDRRATWPTTPADRTAWPTASRSAHILADRGGAARRHR